MEGVFEIVVVLGDVLGDDVGRGAGRDHHRLQPAGPRLERQHDLADIAGDDRVDVVLVDGALEGAHRFRSRGVIVVSDDLDLAAVDAARGVDFVGGELRGLRDRRAGDGLGLGDDADLDRVVDCAWPGVASASARQASPAARAMGANMRALRLAHCHYLPEIFRRLFEDDGLVAVYPNGLGRQAWFISDPALGAFVEARAVCRKMAWTGRKISGD